MGVEGTLHDKNVMLFVAAAIDTRIAWLPRQNLNQLQAQSTIDFQGLG
jgi:hypothetical protein